MGKSKLSGTTEKRNGICKTIPRKMTSSNLTPMIYTMEYSPYPRESGQGTSPIILRTSSGCTQYFLPKLIYMPTDTSM